MDNLLFPSVPLLALLIALLLKRGAIVASVIGSTAVLTVIFYDERYALSVSELIARDLPVVLILTLSVALVIIPGQILNALLQSSGTIKAIGARVETIPLSPVKMASVIVLGVAPMLESMTGFGVSLFFTVPVLVQLFSLRKALILSLLSMNIMPWGTLALATSVGSQIAGVSFDALAVTSSLTSFAVFPAIGFLVFIICKEPKTKLFSGLLCPLLSGIVLSCCLVFYNAQTTAELAGVYAGLTTAALILLFERLRVGKDLLSAFMESRATLIKLFAPYLLLIALIGLSRINFIYESLQDLLNLQSGGVKLFVFTSPGICIFIAVLLLFAFGKNYRRHTHIFRDGLQRAIYPVSGIMLFVLFAQLHRASGIFQDIAARIIHLPLSEIVFIAPLLGMLSGYTTGSNVGGNALFMALQGETGGYFDQQLVFAALQNSSAGHAVFMSLPIILLTLSIAKTGDRDATRAQQTWLVRRTLMYAPIIYAALLLPFYWLLSLSAFARQFLRARQLRNRRRF